METAIAHAPEFICVLASSVMMMAKEYAARRAPPRWPPTLDTADSEAFFRACEQTMFFCEHPAPQSILRAHVEAVAEEHALAISRTGGRAFAEQLSQRLPALHTADVARAAAPPADGDWVRAATPTAAHARAAYDFAASQVDPQAGATALFATLRALPPA
jgi:hypothetical protein